jgi:hypothetical protein
MELMQPRDTSRCNPDWSKTTEQDLHEFRQLCPGGQPYSTPQM